MPQEKPREPDRIERPDIRPLSHNTTRLLVIAGAVLALAVAVAAALFLIDTAQTSQSNEPPAEEMTVPEDVPPATADTLNSNGSQEQR